MSLFNPMLYMIDGFRYAYTGVVDVSVRLDALVVTAFALVALAVAFSMTKRGVNLRV